MDGFGKVGVEEGRTYDIGLYQRCAIIREILIFTRNAGKQLTSLNTKRVA